MDAGYHESIGSGRKSEMEKKGREYCMDECEVSPDAR